MSSNIFLSSVLGLFLTSAALAQNAPSPGVGVGIVNAKRGYNVQLGPSDIGSPPVASSGVRTVDWVNAAEAVASGVTVASNTGIPDYPTGPIWRAYKNPFTEPGSAYVAWVQTTYGLTQQQISAIFTAAGGVMTTPSTGQQVQLQIPTPTQVGAAAIDLSNVNPTQGLAQLGAAAITLSNVNPATGRANIGVGALGVLNTLAGLDASATTALANGSSLARSQAVRYADSINPKDYGARGDTIEFTTGASGTAGSASVTLVGATLSSSDVGKAAVVHGCGTGGISLQGVITAVVDATHATLNIACVLTVSNTRWQYGTDDTASWTAATAAAVAKGGVLRAPFGTYWLASQSSPIPLNRAAMVCDGPTTSFLSPYSTTGCFVDIADTSTSAFDVGQGWAIDGFTFYYPIQDGYSATPIGFPALLTGNNIVNGIFENNTVVNAYGTLLVTNGGGNPGAGRLVWYNNRQYSINRDFDFENGAPDRMYIDGSNIFMPGTFDDIADVSPANLDNYTRSNGELVHIDVAAGTTPRVDGLTMGNALINQKAYGIRIISGTMDVSSFDNVEWDSVLTVLSVEGAASVVSTTFTGGYDYSTNTANLAASPAVWNIASTGLVEFTVTGMNVPFAQGDIYEDTAVGAREISFIGGHWSAWGQSTNTPQTFFAAVTAGNTASNMTFSGLTLLAEPATGNLADGIQIFNNALTNITGDIFANCQFPIILQGGTGTQAMVSGNMSSGTTGTWAIVNSLTGSGLYKDTGNLWDKLPIQAAAP